MVTLSEVLAAIREAPAEGTAKVAGALEAAGLDPGAWVLVDASVWLWLAELADEAGDG